MRHETAILTDDLTNAIQKQVRAFHHAASQHDGVRSKHTDDIGEANAQVVSLALHGAPGVLSARYAGENASNDERITYLLSKLKDVPPEKRSARFYCVIAIAKPDGTVQFCDGECKGTITIKTSGANGFGYDPVFYLPEFGKTMAEIPADVKNQISHRAIAAQKAKKLLLKMAE